MIRVIAPDHFAPHIIGEIELPKLGIILQLRADVSLPRDHRLDRIWRTLTGEPPELFAIAPRNY